MQALFALAAVLAGMTSALQSGSNQTLQKTLEAPFWTVAIVSAVTFSASLLVLLISGERMPGGGAAAGVPWWAWIGGLLGLAFVIATVFVSPKLGAGLFVGLLVTASTCTSLALDHWGLMGFEVHRAGIGRLAGGALMIVGVALIAAF